jgi:uncharacterized repeat protein (TIGR03847 family)
MARRIFQFDAPDRFVCGTVGQPGNRTFFLQVVEGKRLVSVKLEKVQVAVLAQRLGQILTELQRRGVSGVEVSSPRGDDERPLDEPLREEFTVGTLTIGWDGDDSVMVLEARSQLPEEEDDTAAGDDEEEQLEIDDDAPVGPDVVRVRLEPELALGFVRRSARVLSAGRPACPFCGQPLNPEGHICPRRNGYLN